MLSTAKIPPSILNQLVEAVPPSRNFTPLEVVESLTAEQAFEAWCKYEGLLGSYHAQLLVTIDALRAAEVRPLTPNPLIAEAYKQGKLDGAEGAFEEGRQQGFYEGRDAEQAFPSWKRPK